VRVNQKLELYSLERTLLEAHTIERLEDASPLEVIAPLRLMLAVLHRALQGPEDIMEVAQWLERGFPHDEIVVYLDTWKHRFDLFDLERPFYQTAGYTNKSKSIAQLLAERSSGTNKLLFDHTQEEPPLALTPAEAARALIARQMLAIPEGAGYSPSPLGGTAVVIPNGANLLETLCLNMLPYEFKDDDLPIWESEKIRPDAEQVIMGTAHRYTWMSRLIRLEPEGDFANPRVCFLNYGPACKQKVGIIHNPDPMLAYRSDKKTEERRPINFRSEKAFWRDFTAILPKAENDLSPKVVFHALELMNYLRKDSALSTLVLGATNDKAKFEFWRMELHILPEALVANREGDVYASLESCLLQAEEMGKTLNSAARALAGKLVSRGDRDPHKDDVTKMVKSFPTYAVYWSTLEQAFPKLLAQLKPDYSNAQVEQNWLEQVLSASEKAWTATRQAAGDDGYALRAIYTAENRLTFARAKISKRIKEQL